MYIHNVYIYIYIYIYTHHVFRKLTLINGENVVLKPTILRHQDEELEHPDCVGFRSAPVEASSTVVIYQLPLQAVWLPHVSL